MRVTDTGSGIPRHETEAVLRRFYRSDKMRNTPGVGLGLNLVAAIVKLHGFQFVIHPGPGGRMEIIVPGPANGRAAKANAIHAVRSPIFRPDLSVYQHWYMQAGILHIRPCIAE